MNIKPMLMRLQTAMGRDDLIEQMVLLSGVKAYLSQEAKLTKVVNLIVGYNSSPNSQTALDIAFWIAHQTRLATKQEVIVQVVYVVEKNTSSQGLDISDSVPAINASTYQSPLASPDASPSKSTTPVLTPTRPQVISYAPSIKNLPPSPLTSVDPLEQPDRILWQARCLAEEWGGTFKAHLRFGNVVKELKKVAKSETAAVLFLGCNSIQHPIVQKLGSQFPCTVLGIPQTK